MASKTVSNVASEILTRNTLRKSFVIQNEDATDVVYLKRERSENTTVSTTEHDIKLGPGSSFSLNALSDGLQAIVDRWTAVASANTPRVAIFETEDQFR